MNAQKSFWDYFSLAKLFMQAAGVFPIGGTPAQWKSVLAQIMILSPILYALGLTIPLTNYVFFRSHDMDDLLEAIIILILACSGQCRVFFIFINRRKIARLFAACEILWDHASPQDYKVISTWGHRAKLFSTAYFCVAQFAISSFVLTATVKQLSSSANSTIRYYPFVHPENSTPSPQYELKYISQVMIGYFGASSFAAVDMTSTVLVLNMCGQFALIRTWLLELSSTDSTIAAETRNGVFELTSKKCIRRHQIVCDLCIELEEVVRYINLTQIMVGMYVMAISCARLMASLEAIRHVGPLFLAISGLFFSCWPSDNLSFVSSDVAQVVYGIPWYYSSPRVKTAVFIMLMRSQRPIQLTAGKFVVLSLETFSSILSSGLSFCMVLNSF